MSEAIVIRADVARDLTTDVEQLGAYLVQMAQMMRTMQNRLDEMEASQRKVSISHRDVLDIQQLIRIRAADYCNKYDIMDAGSVKAIRTAIKRAVLTRYGVKDLHDVPAIALPAVQAQIDHWTDIRIVMKRRQIIAGGG